MTYSIHKWLAAVCAVSATILVSDLGAKQVQKSAEAITQLQCSGTLIDWEHKIDEMPVSGVYVEIKRTNITTFNIPSFPNYQQGLLTDIYNRNPSMIFSKSSDGLFYINVNRMSGAISAWHYYPYQDIKKAAARKVFEGKCINPKPIF